MRALLAASLLVCASVSAPAAGHDVFRVRQGRDAAGRAHRLGELAGTRAVVLVFLGPECPISQRYVPELNRIFRSYTNGVEFYGVLAGRTMTRTQAVTFVREYAIEYPVLLDDGLKVARWLRPTHMPEVFVLKPDGDRVYRGRISDWYQSPGRARPAAQQHELREALDAVLAGRMPAKSYAPPVGCYFEDWP